MKNLQIPAKDPIVALEEIDNSIALESLSIRTITNRVMDAIPNMVHNARQVLSRVTLPPDRVLNYNYNEKILEKAMSELEYLKIVDLNVYVPKGFSGSVNDYTSLLAHALRLSGDTIARLTVYNQFLSALISHPDTRSSTREYITSLGDREEARGNILNAMAAYFTDKNTTDRQSFGDSFASSSEVTMAARGVKTLIDSMSRDEAKQLHKLVSDTTDLLDALREAGKANQLSNMSPEVFKNLASATLSMARDVELAGTVHYAVDQLARSMMSNSEMLIKIIRYSK